MGIFDIFKRKTADEEMKIQAQEMENKAVREEKFTEQVNGTFLMTIQDVFTIGGKGTVVTGKVESGRAQINDDVIIERTGRSAHIKGIEAFRKNLECAQVGDDVGKLLDNIERNEVIPGDKIKK